MGNDEKYFVFDNMIEGVQVIDSEFHYVYVNESVAKQAKTSKESLEGFTMMEKFPGIEKTILFSYLSECLHKKTPKKFLNEFKFPDNSIGWFELSIQPFEDKAIIMSFDVTDLIRIKNEITSLNKTLELKVAERTEELEQKNRELHKANEIIAKKAGQNEMLVRELHHRVKNNLQLVISLISLYSTKIEDEDVLNALNECQNNIRSLALVHQSLYNSEDVSMVDLSNYICDLCNYYKDVSTLKNRNSKIAITHQLQPIYLPIDKAITFGLIVNELITNSIKHAFIDRNEGEIILRLLEKENTVLFSISDNGNGLPKDFLPANSKGFGLEMIRNLVDQLDGKLSSSNGTGAHFYVSFEKETV